MKLIDIHLNPKVCMEDSSEYLTASLFSNSACSLPQPNKIGSIIRIHRGQTILKDNTTQFSCDLGVMGAWSLFDPKDSIVPVDMSGKTYTFTDNDHSRLKAIRKFSANYFSSSEISAITLKKAENEQIENFDTICYVLDKKNKGDFFNIKLCDTTKVVKLILPGTKPLRFDPLMIIRLRNVNYDPEKKGTHIVLDEHSKILIVPNEYKSAQCLIDALKSKNVSEEVVEELKYYMHDKEFESISAPISNYSEPISFKDLYSGKFSDLKRNTFHVKLKVIEVAPKTFKDWIRILNKTTNRNYSPAYGRVLDSNENWYLKADFFVQDFLCKTDKNLYQVYYCTVDGKGKELIRTPDNELNEEYIRKLKRIYKMLVKPWVVLDCIVEEIKPQEGSLFFIVNTRLII